MGSKTCMIDRLWWCGGDCENCDDTDDVVTVMSQHASKDVEKMVLGNKCDMNDRRQVSKERGEQVRPNSLHSHLLYFSRPSYSSFAHISTEISRQYGSMPVFLKIWTHSFQKVRKSRCERCKFVASEVDRSVDGELSFVDICIFQAISGPELYSWSWLVKKVC